MLYKLIGITGPARSGKDTAADFLLERLPFGFQKFAFADPLKEMVRVGLRLSYDQVNGMNKDIIDERYGVTPRRIMQTLGTEWGRDIINGDLWVETMRDRVEGERAVISDVRFENEAEFIRENGGVIIHIMGRVEAGVENHVSEDGVYFNPDRDIVVSNTGSFTDFHDTLKEVIKQVVA